MPFKAKTASDFLIAFHNSSVGWGDVYDPIGVYALDQRPFQKLNSFLLMGRTSCATAQIEGDELVVTSQLAERPFSSQEDLTSFERDGRLFFGRPNRGEEGGLGQAEVWELLQRAEVDSQEISFQMVFSVPQEQPTLVVASPDEEASVLFTMGEADCSYRFLFLWDMTSFDLTAPSQPIKSLKTIVKKGGGTDPVNRMDFVEHQQGELLGCLAVRSEGVMFLNVSTPTSPTIPASFDPSIFEGSKEHGAADCISSPSDLKFYFSNDDDDRHLFAVQIQQE